MDEVAKAVSARMKERGRSIIELGGRTGVSRHVIGRWLSGERTIKLKDLLPILRDLDLTVAPREDVRARPSKDGV